MKPGRPSLDDRAGLFDVPAATGALGAPCWASPPCCSTTGSTRCSRTASSPGRRSSACALGRVAPDGGRIDAALRRLRVDGPDSRLRAVVPVHTHVDHALDSAVVAARTGAVPMGGGSAA